MTQPVSVVADDLDIAEVRDRVGGLVTDEEAALLIGRGIDADGDVNLDRAAALGWEKMAAKYASMVDVSESGSSRKMGDLQTKAIQMAKMYRDRLPVPVIEVDPVVAALDAVRVTQSVRP